MSYFFSSFFGNDEKQASNSPVNTSTEEEKLTKVEGKQNEGDEYEGIMSTPRKGWLMDWQFWKRNDNSGGGPFNAFRKNKNPAPFTWRKDLNCAPKAKEGGKGEEAKHLAAMNVGTSSSESGEEGQSKATEISVKTENTYDGQSSVGVLEKDVPLATCNDGPNGAKAVALNMKKVAALRDKKQNELQTQQGTAPSASVLEEKYYPNGQAIKPEIKGLGSSAQAASSSANKQKTDAMAKAKKGIAKLPPTTPKEQKRMPGTPQAVPTNTNATPRQENVPKWNPNTKIVADKKNAERKPVENKKIDKKNEAKKVAEAKKAVMIKNDGLNQFQKPVLQKPVFPRPNCAKIDEKPQVSSIPNKTVGNHFKQKDAVANKIADGSKTEVNKPATPENGKQKNVANGSPGLASAPVPKYTNSVTQNQQRPAALETGFKTQFPPQNQRLKRLQNSGAQIQKRNIVATNGFKTASKPSTLQPSQQQRVAPQTAKSQSIGAQGVKSQNTGPQSAKPQNIAPQFHNPAAQNPRMQTVVQQNQCLKSNHSPQVGPKPITPQSQGGQPSLMHSQMPQVTNHPFPIPQNPSEIGPPLKRAYSEVVADPQKPNAQRTRPEGVSAQASPVRTDVGQKQAANRRRAPSLAKPVKPVGETQPVNGETTRQDPKEADNVPKRKILCSRYGREVVIEPNMPVTLPGSLPHTQGTKNVAKPTEIEKKCPPQNTILKSKPELPVKHEKLSQQVEPVKPVMKDATTSTLAPSTKFVDAAVQVPDEEKNVGDEIQSLLVKRPWDTERVMKMQVHLDEKLVVIARMREMLRKRSDEVKSTKKRCEELETVIKASNMQGKPQLVAQVSEMTEIKNELVTEVTNLTVELEKERTNVKSLKTELADVRAQLTAARKKAANPAGQ